LFRQWLIPVTLATEEAEIRRFMVQNQFWTISLGEPISEIPNSKKG
jgi:hypothetical protein